MRLMLVMALAALLSGCVGASVSGIALCQSTRQSRDAHALALVTPPTAQDDLQTGAQALAEIAAGCGE